MDYIILGTGVYILYKLQEPTEAPTEAPIPPTEAPTQHPEIKKINRRLATVEIIGGTALGTAVAFGISSIIYTTRKFRSRFASQHSDISTDYVKLSGGEETTF